MILFFCCQTGWSCCCKQGQTLKDIRNWYWYFSVFIFRDIFFLYFSSVFARLQLSYFYGVLYVSCHCFRLEAWLWRAFVSYKGSARFSNHLRINAMFVYKRGSFLMSFHCIKYNLRGRRSSRKRPIWQDHRTHQQTLLRLGHELCWSRCYHSKSYFRRLSGRYHRGVR